MKKILFIIAFLPCFTAQAQFPSVDSLLKFTDRYIRNSAVEAFTNLRLNTVIHGLTSFIGSGGGGGVDTAYAVNDSTIRIVSGSKTFNAIIRGVYDFRRKVDTIYAVNDSTLSFTINNQTRTILIRGRENEGNIATKNQNAKGDFTHDWLGYQFRINRIGDLGIFSTKQISGTQYRQVGIGTQSSQGLQLEVYKYDSSNSSVSNISKIGIGNQGGDAEGVSLQATDIFGTGSTLTVTDKDTARTEVNALMRMKGAAELYSPATPSAEDSFLTWNPSTKRLGVINTTAPFLDSSKLVASTQWTQQNALSIKNSKIWPTRYSYQALSQVGDEYPLEFLNVGQNVMSGSNRHITPGGLVRNNWSILLTHNMVYDSVNKWWVNGVLGLPAACVEAGYEGVTLHATPAGSDFSAVPHGLFQARAEGVSGVPGITTGFWNQARVPLYAHFSTAAYNPTTAGGSWHSPATDPMLWLHSEELKGSSTNDQEFMRLEMNANVQAGPAIHFKHSRGTYLSKEINATSDISGRLIFDAHDGTAYQSTAIIDGIVRGTVSSGVARQSLRFQTSSTNTAGLTTKMEIDSIVNVFNQPIRLSYTSTLNTVPDYTAVGYIPTITNSTAGQFRANSITNGGLIVEGWTGTNTAANGLVFKSILGSTVPAASATVFITGKHNGATNFTDLATTETAYQFRNNATNLLTIMGGGNLTSTATLPSSHSVTVTGATFSTTSAGSSAFTQESLSASLSSGYTGNAPSQAIVGTNNAAGVSTTYEGTTNSYRPLGNRGVSGNALATTTGHNANVFIAEGGNMNYGVWGSSTKAKNSASNVGVAGFALNTGTSPIHVGGYFGLQNLSTSAPTLVSAALIADNGQTTSPIQIWRDNQTEVMRVADGGAVTITGLAGTGTRVSTANSTGTLGAIVNGTDGQVLTLVSGSPAWSSLVQNYEISLSDTSTTTVANTTSTTTLLNTGLGSATVNNITAGSVLTLRGAGTISTDATAGTPTISFTIANVTINASLSGLANNLVNSPFSFECRTIIPTIGNAKRLLISYTVNVDNNGTPKSYRFSGEDATLNITTSATCNITGAWNTAAANNSIVSQFNTIEINRK